MSKLFALITLFVSLIVVTFATPSGDNNKPADALTNHLEKSNGGRNLGPMFHDIDFNGDGYEVPYEAPLSISKQLNDKNEYSSEYKPSDGQEQEKVGTFNTDENGDSQYYVDGSFKVDENGFEPNGFRVPRATTKRPVPVIDPNATKSLIG